MSNDKHQDFSIADFISSESNKENEGTVQQKKPTKPNSEEQPVDFCAFCNKRTNQDLLFHIVHEHGTYRTVLGRLVFLCGFCNFRSFSPQQRFIHLSTSHRSVLPTDKHTRDMYSYHCHLCPESRNNGVSLLHHFWTEHPDAELPVEESETDPLLEQERKIANLTGQIRSISHDLFPLLSRIESLTKCHK
ncbi:hypothetical protein M3Y98_00069400 [Aphelenchoides besseyi]|nr:hypothetical protein M3Y98_00069400 [Aphelenchoides besseyi]KAI6198772.1 hypothetical protein M3Y96_00554800 [Aphelenchoides besseyi]